MDTPSTCPLCATVAPASELAEAAWVDPSTEKRLALSHPGWQRGDGACPACVQHALLLELLEHGADSFRAGIQRHWPLDPEAAYGALPTPLRVGADPRFAGRDVTIALVDSGFYPHPDLTRPHNRIRVWADARQDPVAVRRFGPDEAPEWPGWDSGAARQWHGTMTAVAAAGNGHRSHGLYAGLAPEAELVLVQVATEEGRIGNAAIARALRWLEREGPALGVRVVNLSLGGDAVDPLRDNPVDAAVASLTAAGVSVLVAAGNDGQRRLVPPATAPEALTVGGLDDRNTFDESERRLWHGNYGETARGLPKPELVAPSLWVVGPLLPGTPVADEAARLFERRRASDPSAEARIAELRLVTPHYQHVEGTSFAAPIASGVVAAMLEANPGLGPRRVRELLVAAARPVPGAPAERQGAGALDAGRALSLALADRHGPEADFAASPVRRNGELLFRLHDHEAREVRLLGSWDGWAAPGIAAALVEPGLWQARLAPAPEGDHAYKFLLDGERWLADPGNPVRSPDGLGGLNSFFEAAAPGAPAPGWRMPAAPEREEIGVPGRFP